MTNTAGYSKPRPWSLRGPAPEPARVVISAPIDRGWWPAPDATCKACGFVEHAPTCVEAPREVGGLPAGWREAEKPYGFVAGFEHHGGLAVWQTVAYHPHWFYGSFVGGGTLLPHATRSEAMAAALGFTIYSIVGDEWSGWCWKRGGECSGDGADGATRGDWPTAEQAAIAALAFDAGQREKAKVEWDKEEGLNRTRVRLDGRAAVWTWGGKWISAPQTAPYEHDANVHWGRKDMDSQEAAMRWADQQLALEDARAGLDYSKTSG